MNDEGSDPTDREGVCGLVPSESDSDGASSRVYYTRNRPESIFRMSDRGSQYTSTGYQDALAQAGMVVSMSRTGNCYDNAVMESFWSTLKCECTSRMSFATRAEAQQVIFEYIECFYQRQRRHSSLGYLSPQQYEEMLT